MSISILNRVSNFRNLAENSNAQYGYIVRLHERHQGMYSIEFPQLREAKKDKNTWRNSYVDIAYFEALPEALSIINEQARIIFELADKLAQQEAVNNQAEADSSPATVDNAELEKVREALLGIQALKDEYQVDKSPDSYEQGEMAVANRVNTIACNALAILDKLLGKTINDMEGGVK